MGAGWRRLAVGGGVLAIGSIACAGRFVRQEMAEVEVLARAQDCSEINRRAARFANQLWYDSAPAAYAEMMILQSRCWSAKGQPGTAYWTVHHALGVLQRKPEVLSRVNAELQVAASAFNQRIAANPSGEAELVVSYDNRIAASNFRLAGLGLIWDLRTMPQSPSRPNDRAREALRMRVRPGLHDLKVLARFRGLGGLDGYNVEAVFHGSLEIKKDRQTAILLIFSEQGAGFAGSEANPPRIDVMVREAGMASSGGQSSSSRPPPVPDPTPGGT
jgi:hypothetical protein